MKVAANDIWMCDQEFCYPAPKLRYSAVSANVGGMNSGNLGTLSKIRKKEIKQCIGLC